MSWKIEFTKAATKQIHSLDASIQTRIKKEIEKKLKTNPDRYLIGLLGELSDLYKFRVGNYRLLCSKDGERLIMRLLQIKLFVEFFAIQIFLKRTYIWVRLPFKKI